MHIFTYVNIICIQIIVIFPSYADGILIGKVSSIDGPLPYVNIGMKGYNLGTYSDEQGKFRIDDIPVGYQTIQFSSVGYKTLEKSLEIKEQNKESRSLQKIQLGRRVAAV